MRQAWYLNELGAILQVLNYGYIEAVVACGQGQRAASHAGAHTRVLGESFAQVASGFWVLRPVTGEEGGRRRSVQGQLLPQQTHTHTHTPTLTHKVMSKEHGRRAESTQKPGDEHIISQRSRAVLAGCRRDIPI